MLSTTARSTRLLLAAAALLSSCCYPGADSSAGASPQQAPSVGPSLKTKPNYWQNQNQWLETPAAARQRPFEGAGVDLVAVNRRRFELGHSHTSVASEQELATGELIESNIAAIPEKILSQLPEELTKELAESFSTDPSLIMGPAAMAGAATLTGSEAASEDPDGASIERLTKSCLMVLASSHRPEQLNVSFQLYTKNNPIIPYIVWPQTSRLELIKSSPFDPSKPIKWITHGFHTNVDKSEWMLETKNKILAFEEANVFLTDWRRGASPALAFYPTAAANAHVVAKIIVKLLRRLRDDIGDLSRVHLIGHSLGAHIMGFVGSAFTEEHLHQQQQQLSATLQVRTDRKWWPERSAVERLIDARQLIGRITACDPALPCFGPTSSAPNNRAPSSQHRQHLPTDASVLVETGAAADDWTPTMWTHLRPDSALVVEVMHSNPGVMGYSDPLGDYDLYPNGLERQPGCGVGPPTLLAAATPQDLGNLLRSVGHESPSKQSWWFFGGGGGGSRQLSGPPSGLGGFPDANNGEPPAPMTQSARASPSSMLVPGEAQAGVGDAPTRFSNTFDKLIKPIRDFFQGYTCSHHRSVEYMVESMYYENVPQDRRLDRDLVCQMVGYRCADYLSFKKGFCFQCRDPSECRSFTLGVTGSPMAAPLQQAPIGASDGGRRHSKRQHPRASVTPTSGGSSDTSARGLAKFAARLIQVVKPPDEGSFHGNGTSTTGISINGNGAGDSLLFVDGSTVAPPKEAIKKLIKRTGDRLNSTRNPFVKRMLPTFDHREHEFIPQRKSLYYFDTRPAKRFCLHHYHLFIKYRWFRVRPSLAAEGLKILGTLANITVLSPLTFNMFTFQSYTMLLTEGLFLGQVESLVLLGGQLRPTLIEYIEVTYMSNLDARIRALGSARLCRQTDGHLDRHRNRTFPASAAGDPFESQDATRFLRCSGPSAV